MGGGSFCCMVGCGAESGRCRGLSFHGFPKEGRSEDINLWRKRLIACVNRIDESFNPNNAKICSRHFEENCFTIKPSGRRYLKPWSIPTCFMPVYSVEPQRTPPQKPPMEQQSGDNVNNQEDFSEEEELVPCPGITNQDLQEYAELPPTNASDLPITSYYLDVSYYQSDGSTLCKTTIRSQECTRKVVDGKEACTACLDAKRLVLQKQLNENSSLKQGVKRSAPLSRVIDNKPRQKRKKQRKIVHEEEEVEKIKQEVTEDIDY